MRTNTDKGADFATQLMAIKGHNPEYIQPSSSTRCERHVVQTHYVTQFLVTNKLREHVSLFLLHKIVSPIDYLVFLQPFFKQLLAAGALNGQVPPTPGD